MKNILKICVLLAILATVQFTYGFPQLIADLKTFAETHANPFVFLAIMSIGCAVGFPMSFCTLFAGAAFGSTLGSTLSIIGIAISSSLGFLIGKFFCPETLVARIKTKFRITKRKNMFDLNFYVRAVPGIPYSAQNVILGAMNSEFPMYMALGVSIQGTIAVAMCVFGANFSDDGIVKYAAIAALITIVICIRLIFKRVFKL